MTEGQEETWSSDANCYVVDEDVDAFGARSSCEMLLAELKVPSRAIESFRAIATAQHLTTLHRKFVYSLSRAIEPLYISVCMGFDIWRK